MTIRSLALTVALGLPGAAGTPRTLFQMGGAVPAPARLSEAVLVLIDAQREYLDGALPLAGMEAAVGTAAGLLKRARAANTPVIHVVHRGGGGVFDPATPGFEIVAPLRPLAGEPVVEKRRISAFAGTGLEAALRRTGRTRVILVGFMTHNCVSTTARDANDLGFSVTLLAPATATRDLPDGRGGVLSAAALQAAELAALADRTACVAWRSEEIPD
ncbi:cysteine hydrolase family protein [Mesoterricola sediminis]|uniref:Isochorismatase n=1 Tax=Mesoterricola sediminis TaxID=2927980 RepID=A0AA48H6D8_9BACT|nr:cysteine hydrolase family protein [Mesoterricola sediminis]BDU78211.1 isochorismatase [Mesoterricola sediminis]